MLSKKQMRKLIRSVYGANTEYGKQIEQLYKRANRQIQGEISAFISSRANWSGKPSKADLEDVRQQLLEANEQSVAPLVAVYLSSVTLGHPKNGDVETARIALPMIKVAKQMHRAMNNQQQRIPRKVSQISQEQHAITPEIHRIPINYNTMLQREVSQSVTQRQTPASLINRDIQNTVSRIQDVAKQASTSNETSIDWAKKIDRILTGHKSHGGASKKAQRIIRTESCRELNGSTIGDFKARGVKKYRFLSLESSNSCKECTSLDGNVYDVEDAQEGVNLPPMHPDCQCWIVEYEDDDTDDMPTGSEMDIDEDS
ncbi:phage head morphogenesis protein [Limosilactobacillus reuteri]|uniref:Phage head morphogenesis protein n=2 Tax=Limosilactobacillus reuteri TaxID=1598 RepID=A0A1Y2UQ78_LIMRT|nr:minor capsid protein [Limosilactobacillus reuteri]OTA82772.1 phage head morphogenesis protein [Limosilactobacillus reuteri]OTA85370.1 phage head morphogenesis protein [Limosilactobacillus reuteri]